MSHYQGLLQAVCHSPHDDAPRLIMADWYQENGDEDRAEFIRLQCKLYRMAKIEPLKVVCNRCGRTEQRRRWSVQSRCVRCKGSLRRTDGKKERFKISELPREETASTINRIHFLTAVNHERWAREILDHTPIKFSVGKFIWSTPPIGIKPGTVMKTYPWTWIRGFITHIEMSLTPFEFDRCPGCQENEYCNECAGSGFVAGTKDIAGLFNLAPITSVHITNKHPNLTDNVSTANSAIWYHPAAGAGGHGDNRGYVLPIQIFRNLRNYKFIRSGAFDYAHYYAKQYPDQRAAYAALSNVCVSLGRKAAQLPRIRKHAYWRVTSPES